MKRLLASLLCALALAFATPGLVAQPSEPAPTTETAAAPSEASAETTRADADAPQKATAAAASKATRTPPRADFLEHLVDQILGMLNVRSSENTWTHYTIALLFLVGSFILRHIVTGFIFRILKKFAERTTTTLDDKLFPALEQPVATFVSVLGIFAALNVLKLSETTDVYIGYGSTIAFSLVVFWGLLRAFGAVLDHMQEVAVARQMGVAAFMPWIKRTLLSIFVVFGLLMVVQSLGFDVKALLAGLGIGGLAFALAAQDTLANVFGSIVVAIDQPFRVGEFVQIGSISGTVEDIGLRSTKLRRLDRSLVIVPNKTVASEVIQNQSRFMGRRAEQVLTFTYDATPEQLEGIVTDLRELLTKEKEIDPASVHVYFRDLNTFSLDVWVAYNSVSPDFAQHMRLRQRLNLTFMRLAAARGLAFAFPTQTLQFDGEVARRIAEARNSRPHPAP